MKEMIKKSALLGLIGVPVFIISVAVSNRIINGISTLIDKQKKIKK